MRTQLLLTFAFGAATSLYAQKMDSKDVPDPVKAGLQKPFAVRERR